MPALEIIALDETTPKLRAPSSADTYLAPRALSITPVSLTGATAVSSLDITQVWNTTGTPTALRLNVTDTASNAASLLMDLRVGGSSRFSVTKGGIVTVPQTVTTTASFQVAGGGGNSGFGSSNGFDWNYTRAGSPMLYFGFERFCVGNGSLTWASSPGGTADILLRRDAANTLAQRNGVNAQTKRIYGTYTDASNHRRVALAMTSAGVATLKAEGAGTGATGNVLHISSLPTSNPGPGILWNNLGVPAIGT